MNHRVIIYLIVSFFVLLMSYEHEQSIAEAMFHHTVSEEEAIRLRILANSDSIKDQWLKKQVRSEVNEHISNWIAGVNDLEEARAVIKEKLPEIERIVARVLQEAGTGQTYQVQFGEVQFPTKLYGNFVYPAGVYEAVLITLGEGKGENWWCVLFPPLCFLDFEHSDAVPYGEEAEEENEAEVKFFIADLFTKIKQLFTA